MLSALLKNFLEFLSLQNRTYHVPLRVPWDAWSPVIYPWPLHVQTISEEMPENNPMWKSGRQIKKSLKSFSDHLKQNEIWFHAKNNNTCSTFLAYIPTTCPLKLTPKSYRNLHLLDTLSSKILKWYSLIQFKCVTNSTYLWKLSLKKANNSTVLLTNERIGIITS